MKSFILRNSFLISAILYPLSWAYYSGPNVGFLAWICFVPLFVFLERNRGNFSKFMAASFFVTVCWTSVTASWLFQFTQPTWLIATIIFIETIHIWLPFLMLFFIQKKTGFTPALLLFPLIWAAWEWIYLTLPHSLSTHSLAYTQGNNLWLIQMADLGGMWLVVCWVMYFNVLVYLIYRWHGYEFASKQFVYSILKMIGVMILPPYYTVGIPIKNMQRIQVRRFKFLSCQPNSQLKN